MTALGLCCGSSFLWLQQTDFSGGAKDVECIGSVAEVYGLGNQGNPSLLNFWLTGKTKRPSFLESLSWMVILEKVATKRRNYMIKSHSPFSQGKKKCLNVAVHLNTAKLSVTNPLQDFLYTHTLPNTHICICAFLIPDRLCLHLGIFSWSSVSLGSARTVVKLISGQA